MLRAIKCDCHKKAPPLQGVDHALRAGYAWRDVSYALTFVSQPWRPLLRDGTVDNGCQSEMAFKSLFAGVRVSAFTTTSPQKPCGNSLQNGAGTQNKCVVREQ